MGKAARTKAKQKRLQEKRSRKQAMRALYESYRDRGVNTKSKRARQSMNRKTVSNFDHPDGKCGNPACVECHGMSLRPFLYPKGLALFPETTKQLTPVPTNMPNWMYKKWVENNKCEKLQASG